MKLFASDYDGTLYFGKRNLEIYKKNINSIKEFQKENIFAIVTGRDHKVIQNHMKESKMSPNYIACFNGGLIFDKEYNVLFEDKLNIEFKKLFDLLSQSKAQQFVALGENQQYHQFCRITLKTLSFYLFTIRKNRGTRKNVCLKNINPNDVYMCSVVCLNEKDAEEIANEIKKLKLDCSIYFNNRFIDIVGKNTSKKHAVEIIAQDSQINDIYVIGDSYNDLNMINEFGGFTVKSANDDIKRCAKKVYDSVSDAIKDVMQHE